MAGAPAPRPPGFGRLKPVAGEVGDRVLPGLGGHGEKVNMPFANAGGVSLQKAPRQGRSTKAKLKHECRAALFRLVDRNPDRNAAIEIGQARAFGISQGRKD
jgi:hypothetical protein